MRALSIAVLLLVAAGPHADAGWRSTRTRAAARLRLVRKALKPNWQRKRSWKKHSVPLLKATHLETNPKHGWQGLVRVGGVQKRVRLVPAEKASQMLRAEDLAATFRAAQLISQYVKMPNVLGLTAVKAKTHQGTTYKGAAWVLGEAPRVKVPKNLLSLRRRHQSRANFENRRDALRAQVTVLLGFLPRAGNRLKIVTTGEGPTEEFHLYLDDPSGLRMPDDSNIQELQSPNFRHGNPEDFTHTRFPLQRANPALHEFLYADMPGPGPEPRKAK